jgi:cystathionine beta-lyase/cystathionine gamma-synthase
MFIRKIKSIKRKLEAAGSVTLEFPDLKNLVKKAKKHGVLTALDNTWGLQRQWGYIL